ncbi:hypothetical protein R1sor_025213 [Riccia sorocarpa]|uniref:Bet v I/Major latex protein domain-containing protein n=1 Tax=Riccia sorocarpa TaxID=122646 RepID=A0ABD3GB78_9MARC
MPTLTQEIELDVAAAVVWNSLKDQHTLFPKIAPQVFSSIEHVEGPEDGVPGSVRKISFGSIAPPGSYVKEKILAIDMEKHTVTSEEIEGGHLQQGFSKWVHTLTVVPVNDTRSKLLLNTEYEFTDSKAASNGEVLERTKEGMTQLFKAFEGYLKSPDVTIST